MPKREREAMVRSGIGHLHSPGVVFGLLAVGWCAGPACAQAPNPVVATGVGRMDSFDPKKGGESLAVELKIRNNSDHPVKILRAETFLACQGGWSYSMGEMIAKEGKFFGGEPVLGARGEYVYQFGYVHSTPVTHFLMALQTQSPGRPPQDHLLQVPFDRPRFKAPPAILGKAPVWIALQEPVEVVDLTSGEAWLTIIGQFINTSGKPLTLRRLRLRVKSGTVVELNEDVTGTYKLEGGTDSVNEFFYGFILAQKFRKGTLDIETEFELPERRVPVSHVVEVDRVTPHATRAPVEGTWHWGNGPGELAFHTHFHFPEQRYAYDMVVWKDSGGERKSYSGDPKKNESYFCFDQPIHCAEDGKVFLVIDDVPDNFGNTPNPAAEGKGNAVVMVEHAGGHYSAYYHVRQGSATVKAGEHVKAGQVLGRVGNAGASSEPHLHFQYSAFDLYGRFKSIPIRVNDLKFTDGRPAQGVPKGGIEYVSHPAQ